MSTEYDKLCAEVQRLAERIAVLEQEMGTRRCDVVPVDIPEWVKYIAMDSSGVWYGYEHIPTCTEYAGTYCAGDNWMVLDGFVPAYQPHDWRESLRRIR